MRLSDNKYSGYKNYVIESGWDSSKVTCIPNFVNPNNKTLKQSRYEKQKIH